MTWLSASAPAVIGEAENRLLRREFQAEKTGLGAVEDGIEEPEKMKKVTALTVCFGNSNSNSIASFSFLPSTKHIHTRK